MSAAGRRSVGRHAATGRAVAIAVRRRPSLGLALVVCLAAAACQLSDEPPPRPLRLVDRVDTPESMRIAGMAKPTLPRKPYELRIALDGVPPRPYLTFATGVKPLPDNGRVGFRLLLEPRAGAPVELFSREVDEPGWQEHSVDLSGRDLAGAALVFQRYQVSGPMGRLVNTAWGNPMLYPGAPRQRPSVILVSLDTVRADRLGVYGHAIARTPVLDGLAAAGARYTHAYSPSTWTTPSHAGLLYGRHLDAPPSMLRHQKLVGPEFDVPDRPLAALLREAGYVTAGFTGGGFLEDSFGFQIGFDTYSMYQQPPAPPGGGCAPERLDGASVFEEATSWLLSHHRQPFFLFVHTYEAHDRCPFLTSAEGLRGGGAIDPDLAAEMLGHYDSLIGRADGYLGRLLGVLDDLGLRDSTLVVVTSDHGESFGEHGVVGHGCKQRPYEELTRVPLILRWPDRIAPNTRIDAPVSLIDVAPTILALLGLKPEAWMHGGILPGLDLPGGREPESVYTACGEWLAIRRGDHKLIAARSGADADERYYLRADPTERRPVAADVAPFPQLRAEADRFWSRQGPPAKDAALDHLDPGTRERLRALGYLE